MCPSLCFACHPDTHVTSREERKIESLRTVNPWNTHQLQSAFSGMSGGSDTVDFDSFSAWVEQSDADVFASRAADPAG